MTGVQEELSVSIESSEHCWGAPAGSCGELQGAVRVLWGATEEAVKELGSSKGQQGTIGDYEELQGNYRSHGARAGTLPVQMSSS